MTDGDLFEDPSGDAKEARLASAIDEAAQGVVACDDPSCEDVGDGHFAFLCGKGPESHVCCAWDCRVQKRYITRDGLRDRHVLVWACGLGAVAHVEWLQREVIGLQFELDACRRLPF